MMSRLSIVILLALPALILGCGEDRAEKTREMHEKYENFGTGEQKIRDEKIKNLDPTPPSPEY